MPRRRLARRFEPRYGVSEYMVQQEAVWLARELDDHLLWSTLQLQERLARLHPRTIAADANIQLQIESLPQRESLALRSMLARDFYHVLALYEKFFRDYNGVREPIPIAAQEVATANAQNPDRASISGSAFKEWLFEPQ
jgi:hypothetical protein